MVTVILGRRAAMLLPDPLRTVERHGCSMVAEVAECQSMPAYMAPVAGAVPSKGEGSATTVHVPEWQARHHVMRQIRTCATSCGRTADGRQRKLAQQCGSLVPPPSSLREWRNGIHRVPLPRSAIDCSLPDRHNTVSLLVPLFHFRPKSRN